MRSIDLWGLGIHNLEIMGTGVDCFFPSGVAKKYVDANSVNTPMR